MNYRDNWNLLLLSGSGIGRIIGAIVVLLVGLWIAGVVGKAVTKALSRTNVDQRGNSYFGETTSVSKVIGKAVKYFIVLVTIMFVLQLLSFSAILAPFGGFIGSIMTYIPNVLGAVILAAIAHILGTLLKKLVMNLVFSLSHRRNMDKLLQYRDLLGNLAYALVILFFATSILNLLNIPAISGPIGLVIAMIINYLPLVAGAVVLIILGHLIAKFVGNLVRTLAASMNLQRWTGPGFDVATFIGKIVYFLILFPIAVQALNLLQIRSIQEPAQNILNLVMSWIPKIAVAAFLLYIGYIMAKVVRNLTQTLLSPLKIDEKVDMLLPMLKRNPEQVAQPGVLADATSGASAVPVYPVTRWIANVISVLVFGFFLVEATNVLDLAFISSTVAALMVMLPRFILVALIILAGIILGKLASQAVSPTSPMKNFIQPVIIVLAVVIGLTEIGLASVIITSGYLIVMGALAVTFIISVGIGSIPAVKRYWEKKQSGSV
ncbi:hypothetical protein E5161_00305 [Cohnella pontilimi]|uniref:Uncharacterized protein n=1 Tax=Cohnella pontilimi TaxID=2564100 RepID=A0A4V5LSP2_9BACL|nr:mechanosensitive ion channel [Cohnella pontilimi]TJY43889.1 hypothetical protein E5161_00305 [Cohnella pontilimi]